MRILIFNWRDWKHPFAGGAEVYTHEVAEQWVAQGHQVTLFCGGAPGLADLDLSGGVTIVRRGTKYTVYREARRFYERQGRGNFDLVVDEVNTRPFLCPTFVDDAPVIALIHQVAREIWFHEFPFPGNVAGRYFFERRWLRMYRNVPVVTVSESSRESLADYGLNDVTVVPEGLSMPSAQYNPPKEQTPTVMFCGRFSSNKRPDHALASFALAKARLPEMKLWMVGSGRMQPELERRAGDNVEFAGRVSHEEKFEMMAKAHLLVATSVREGWGLVVSEAAAVGTLTIGYNVPGLRDSIKASNGVLVEPRPEALADHIAETLPLVAAGSAPKPVLGGVAPWAEVAAAILAAAKVAAPSGER